MFQVEKITGGKIQIVRDQLCIIDENPGPGDKRIFWHEPALNVMQRYLDCRERYGDSQQFEEWYKDYWIDMNEAINSP
ncbi:MAG: hypothetical protein LBR79_03705 [Oscillospiraceae bacterium]|nr:hypothetical protein [Oscillospiraceae bacterium]